MVDNEAIHREGRRLVADIIRRKQEADAWAQYEQDKRDAYRAAGSPAILRRLDPRERVADTLRLDPRPVKRDSLEWRRANPPLLDSRPAVVQWP